MTSPDTATLPERYPLAPAFDASETYAEEPVQEGVSFFEDNASWFVADELAVVPPPPYTPRGGRTQDDVGGPALGRPR